MKTPLVTRFALLIVAIGAVAAMPLQATAQSGSDTGAVLDHHLAAFGNLNLEEILADYTDESLLFTPNGVVRGLEGIKAVFEAFFTEFGKPGASFEMHQKLVEDNVAYIICSAETADNVYEFATDTFVVENGKIVRQSLAAKVTPKN